MKHRGGAPLHASARAALHFYTNDRSALARCALWRYGAYVGGSNVAGRRRAFAQEHGIDIVTTSAASRIVGRCHCGRQVEVQARGTTNTVRVGDVHFNRSHTSVSPSASRASTRSVGSSRMRTHITDRCASSAEGDARTDQRCQRRRVLRRVCRPGKRWCRHSRDTRLVSTRQYCPRTKGGKTRVRAMPR
jgi:hypothetical protein